MIVSLVFLLQFIQLCNAFIAWNVTTTIETYDNFFTTAEDVAFGPVVNMVRFNHGRGSTQYAFGSSAAGSVTILSSYYNPITEATDYMLGKTFAAAGFWANGFVSTGLSGAVDLLGDKVTGDMLWVSGTYNDGTNDLGYITMLRGHFNKWTQQAVLSVDAATDTNFGTLFEVDRHHLRTLAAVCSTCFTEQVRVFDATSPSADEWELSDLLIPGDDFTVQGGNLNSALGTKGFVEVYDDIILVGADNDAGVRGALVYKKGPSKKWSLQQFVFPPGSIDATAADVYGTTIALGVPVYTTNDGAVYIYEMGSAIPGPNARVPQWSQKQVLLSTELNEFFGTTVSMYEDTMFIGGYATTNDLFHYQRKGGMWSFQSMLAVGDASNINSVFVHGSSGVAGLDNTADASGVTFSTNANWNCLVISLEDEFGDGWDTAKLAIKSPIGEVDYFYPSCGTNLRLDNPRSFTFRYCPTEANEDGLYQLSIPNAPQAKFHWEINWKVFVENLDEHFYGDHATRMDFHFDSNENVFRPLAMHHLVQNVTNCTFCPGAPPGVNSAVRKLQVATRAPTVGTESITVTDWHWIELYDDSNNNWFDINNQGAKYFISDVEGKRLISWGMKCKLTTNEYCYQELPNGVYTFRMGGHKFETVSDIEWEFCQQLGDAMTELIFRVQDNVCTPIYKYTLDQYCNRFLDTAITLSITLLLKGLGADEASALSSSELQVIQQAVASVFPGTSESDVSIMSIHGGDGGALMKVDVICNMNKLGYGESMDAGIVNFASNTLDLITPFESSIWAYVIGHNSQGSNVFASLKSVDVIDASMTNVASVANTVVENEPEFVYADSHVKSSSASSEADSLVAVAERDLQASMVVLGYVLVGCTVLVVGFYVFSMKSATVQAPKNASTVASTGAAVEVAAVSSNGFSKVDLNAASSSSSSDSEEEPVQAVTRTAGKKQYAPVSASTTKTNKSALSLSDLKKMIKEEDDSVARNMGRV